jgi:L-aspartate oxidase
VGSRAGREAAAHATACGITRAVMPDRANRPVLSRSVLQSAMSRDASVVRDGVGLRRLAGLLDDTAGVEPTSRQRFEDAALTATAQALAAAAAARTESRGCHHRSDFPHLDDAQARSTVVRLIDGRMAVDAPAAVC